MTSPYFHFDRGIAHNEQKRYRPGAERLWRGDPARPELCPCLSQSRRDAREQARDRSRNSRSRSGDPARSHGRSSAYQEPRRRLQDQTRLGSRHRRLWRGDPAGPERYKIYIYARGAAYLSKQDCDRAIGDFAEVIRLEPKAAGAFTLQGRAIRQKGFRAGRRRFYRGDPADAARPRAVYRPRFGLSLRRRSRPRDRRVYRGARHRSEIGARLSGSRLDVSRQRRVRPRPCRLRPGASARSEERPHFFRARLYLVSEGLARQGARRYQPGERARPGRALRRVVARHSGAAQRACRPDGEGDGQGRYDRVAGAGHQTVSRRADGRGVARRRRRSRPEDAKRARFAR